MRTQQGWLPRILIGLALAYLGVLIVWPVAAIFQGAFSRGVGRFVEELTQPDVLQAFWLTFALAAGAVVVNAVFGTIVTWVLVRQNFTGRSFLNGIIDLPFVVSPVIAGYMVILLF